MSTKGTRKLPCITSLGFATTAARNLLNIEKDIEKRIKSEVFQRGIRIKDFFYDFDKLRKGFVTEDKVIYHQLCLILDSSNLHLQCSIFT